MIVYVAIGFLPYFGQKYDQTLQVWLDQFKSHCRQQRLVLNRVFFIEASDEEEYDIDEGEESNDEEEDQLHEVLSDYL